MYFLSPDGLPRPYVETCNRVAAGTSEYLCGRVYSDGFGAAARQVAQVGPNAYAGVAAQYDFAGRPVRETLSTACGADIACASLTASRTTQVIERIYDALGRTLLDRTVHDSGVVFRKAWFYGALARSQPAGSGTGTQFDAVLSKDADGLLMRHVTDGSRLVWTDECNASVAATVETLVGTECGGFNETFQVYEASGELREIYDATKTYTTNHRVRYRFDTLGRARFIENPNGGTDQTAYFANGAVASSINARGQTTSFLYDVLDRVTTVTTPERIVAISYADPTTRNRTREATSNYAIDYTWDDFDRMASRVQTAGGITLRMNFETDLLGRPVFIEYPATVSRVGYFYTGPNLTKVCALQNPTTCFSDRIYLSDAVYDTRGRLDQAVMPPGVMDLTYNATTDRLDRITASTGSIFDLSYTYKPSGRIESIADASGAASPESSSASFAYDVHGRLASWTRTATSETKYFSFDIVGNLVGRDLASAGGTPNQFFDGTRPNALTSRTVGAATKLFDYDADGNMTRRDPETGATQFFVWNSQNRLACVKSTASGSTCNVASYIYDVGGARILEYGGSNQISVVGDWATWFGPAGGGNQVARIYAFGRVIAEETRGNVGARTAAFFPDLMPPWAEPVRTKIAAVPPSAYGSLSTFAFGALLFWGGRRLRADEALALHPVRVPASVFFALVIATPWSAQASGGGSTTNTIRWVFGSAVGSGLAYADQAGTVVRRRAFEPFGKLLSETGTESPARTFAGERRNSVIGLYDYGARWYDAESGSFTAVDPLGALGSPALLNGYSYVGGDPANFNDPTGLICDGCLRTDPYVPPEPRRDPGPFPWELYGERHYIEGEDRPFYGSDKTWLDIIAEDFLAEEASAVAPLPRQTPRPPLRLVPPPAPLAAISGWSLGLLAALAIFFVPTPTAGPELDEVDEDDLPLFRHYTGEAGRAGIMRFGIIRPSEDGFVYVTTGLYDSGREAQARLALKVTPTGYFEVRQPAIPWGTVPPGTNNQPGGGEQWVVPGPALPGRWVGIGP